jgi:superfamily II DNA or RNA helicase
MPSCKLIIKDEVNLKVEGLPVEIRRKLVTTFKYTDPTARYRPSYKLGRWDGTITLFGMGGNGYVSQLPKILEVLENSNYEIESIEDLRESFNLSFTKITSTYWADEGKCWPEGHRFEGQPITLREDQVEVVNRFLENPQSLQEVATGAGKTIMTATLSQLCEPYGRTMVIVPNKDLVTQTEEDFRNVGLDVGVYYGDRKELNKTHTICTWQSLNNLLKATQEGTVDFTINDFIEGVVCVIVDEVHQAKAEVLKDLLTGVLSRVPIRWGLTGTIPKADFDKLSLLVSLGPVVGKLSASELQEQGVLAQCHVNIVQLKDGKEYKDYQSELKFLTTDQLRLDTIAKLIDKIKDTGNTLVLVDRISAGKELVERLPNSVFVSGEMKLTERKEEYDEIRTSEGRILVCTYGVAAVGINVPRLFNIVMLEPGKSFVRVIQSIGRGLRMAEDKDHVAIWDITSDCKFSKRHLSARKAFYKEASYPFSIEKLDY